MTLDPEGPGSPAEEAAVAHGRVADGSDGVRAAFYAACIGEVDGIRLLSPELVESARTPMTDHVETAPEFAAITTMPPSFGLGFQLP